MGEPNEKTFQSEIPNQDDSPPFEEIGDGIDIFVSYRVRPDEGLAGELKNLLESSIEPKPRVFVSGLGGGACKCSKLPRTTPSGCDESSGVCRSYHEGINGPRMGLL